MERLVNIERVAGSHRSVDRRSMAWEDDNMLIRKVEKFLREHDMPATKFGRLAAGDPRFVLDLRLGRTPRAKTEARIVQWMDQYEAPPALPALETKGFAYV